MERMNKYVCMYVLVEWVEGVCMSTWVYNGELKTMHMRYEEGKKSKDTHEYPWEIEWMNA